MRVIEHGLREEGREVRESLAHERRVGDVGDQRVERDGRGGCGVLGLEQGRFARDGREAAGVGGGAGCHGCVGEEGRRKREAKEMVERLRARPGFEADESVGESARSERAIPRHTRAWTLSRARTCHKE